MSSLSARLLVSVSVLLLLFFGATVVVTDLATRCRLYARVAPLQSMLLARRKPNSSLELFGARALRRSERAR